MVEVAGRDVCIIAKTDRKVDVSGIEGHELNDLDKVTAGGVVKSQQGEVTAIMHQDAHITNSSTIHS